MNDDATCSGTFGPPNVMTDAVDNTVNQASAEIGSDYGSEFSPEEESLLDELLHAAPQLDNPNSDPDLQVKEAEHDESSQSIKLPRWILDQAHGAKKNTFSPSSGDTPPIAAARDSPVPETSKHCP